jgi:uncharacterized glyoxalase superfamily protein PhnB
MEAAAAPPYLWECPQHNLTLDCHNGFSAPMSEDLEQHVFGFTRDEWIRALAFDNADRPHMERAIPVLPADDLRVAKEFYVNRLGFGVRFEATEDGTRGLLGVDRGTISLTLDCPMTGHGREACVSLQVDDADAYYDEWRDRVEIRRAPQNESWGARTFDVIDPFGNTIFVMGPVK